MYFPCANHYLHVLTSHLNFATALEVGTIVIIPILYVTQPETGSPGGSVVKNLPANAGDSDWIPGLGRSPRGGNGSPLQYSCLENPTNRGTWRATIHRVAKSQIRLSNWTCVQPKTQRLSNLPRLHTWKMVVRIQSTQAYCRTWALKHLLLYL